MPTKSTGAVTIHGRRVGHHSRQQRSRPEFDPHNSGHRGRTDTIDTSTFPLWRKTDSVTLWNRTANGQTSHEATPKDTKTGRHLLETSRKSLSQIKDQEKFEPETPSSCKRIAALVTCGERRGQKNSRTPWSRRKHFSPPYSAGHHPGG